MKSQITSTIVKDTTYAGTRWITFEIEVPKFLLAQINTHRMLVKNYQSSRAVPSKNILEQDIYIPSVVVENQSGMVGSKQIDNYNDFCDDYTSLCNMIKQRGMALQQKYNIHKQHINRFFESFSTTRGVISGKLEDLEHMFKLRCDPHAQPEFQELAGLMRQQVEQSTPITLQHGEFHLPYVSDIYHIYDGEVCDAIMSSASSIAQVSYRKRNTNLNKAIEIFQKLQLNTDHPHVSAIQHIAMAVTPSVETLKSETENYTQLSKLLENDGLKFDDQCRLVGIINFPKELK